MKNIFNFMTIVSVVMLVVPATVSAQNKGHINNVQAYQRMDGSDTIDVTYDFAGYAESYIIQACLYSGSVNTGIIPNNFCSGDYGPGVTPGNNKHFAYHAGGHKPGSEWNGVRIEIRVTFPMGNPCPGLSSVTYYGVEYPTIQIGGQCWLQKNLNTGTMIPFENLPWNDDNIEKYCYNNVASNCETYGALYHWWEAMAYGSAIPGKQGICPPGFHIPTYLEFEVLTDLFGGTTTAGGHLKAQNFWDSPNTGAANTSFFTAYGAGTGYNTPGIGGGDLCYDLQKTSYLFHSNLPANEHKPALKLRYNNAAAEMVTLPAEPFPFGSVRCMKDCDDAPSPANAGPDQSITNSNYTVLAAAIAQNGIGKWKITSQHSTDKTGIFEDAWKPNSGFYGFPGQTYTLSWVVSNECTAISDECTIAFSALTCGEPFTDHRNGKTYNTVLLGDYCWMADNMDIGEMAPLDGYVFNDGIMHKFCYNDIPANCDTFGGLYVYGEAVQYQYALENKRGICPLGWFVPKDADWCNLTQSIDNSVNCSAIGWTGTDAGGKMKKQGANYWDDPNTGATNESGFRAVGGGYATIEYPEFAFLENKQSARFWTSTVGALQYFYYWGLGYNEARVQRSSVYPSYNANSVRCVYYPNY